MLADRFHHLALSLAHFVVVTWVLFSALSLSVHLCHTHVDIMFPTPSLTDPHTHTHFETSYPSHTNKHATPARLPIRELSRRAFF